MKNNLKKIKRTGWIAFAAILLVLMSCEASATILLATQNFELQQSQTGEAANLDLDGSKVGIQSSVNFKTKSPNQLIRVIFAAEAGIAGINTNVLDDTIFIDNVACTPSGDSPAGNALVSGDGMTSTPIARTSAITQCFTKVKKKGVHSISIKVTPIPSPMGWMIGTMSVVIDSN